MKKFFKKLFLTCFIFFMAFSCFACSQITYNVNLKSNGSVVANVYVDLTKLNSSNRQIINWTVQTYYKQLDKKYEENLINLFQNIYNFDELFLISNQQKIEYIFSKQSSKFLVGDTECKTESQYPYISIEKQFVSVYAYLLYFYPSAFVYDEESDTVKVSSEYKAMIDVPLSNGLQEDEYIFFNKYIQTCQPFMYDGEEPKFLYDNLLYTMTKGQTIKDYLESRTTLTSEELELIFNFSTPYRRLHSDGTFSTTDDGYTHTWVLGDVQNEVTFWRNYPKTIPFYVVSVVCGISILIFGSILILIVNEVKKKKGLKMLKKIDDFQNKE